MLGSFAWVTALSEVTAEAAAVPLRELGPPTAPLLEWDCWGVCGGQHNFRAEWSQGQFCEHYLGTRN